MQKYYIEVIWNYINDKTKKLLNVLYWIILEIYGGGVKFCLPERYLPITPGFFSFSKMYNDSPWNEKQKINVRFLIYNLL